MPGAIVAVVDGLEVVQVGGQDGRPPRVARRSAVAAVRGEGVVGQGGRRVGGGRVARRGDLPP